MVAYRKRNYRRKSSIKKRTYKKKSNVKTSFAKKVKSVISRMAENKMSNFRGSLNIQAATATSWANSVIPCTPYTSFLAIDQGTGQGQRIGNSIRVKKLKISGVLRPLPYNVTTNTDPVPLFVKLMFMTRKDSTTVVSPIVSDLLQYGGASESMGFQLGHIMRPINLDDWTVHTTRTFKLGYSSYEGTSIDPAAQSFANNDFKLCHFVNVDLTKYCPKVIKFDDNTFLPSTRNVVMYPFVYRADASAPITNAEIPAVFEMNLDFQYEDI